MLEILGLYSTAIIIIGGIVLLLLLLRVGNVVRYIPTIRSASSKSCGARAAR